MGLRVQTLNGYQLVRELSRLLHWQPAFQGNLIANKMSAMSLPVSVCRMSSWLSFCPKYAAQNHKLHLRQEAMKLKTRWAIALKLRILQRLNLKVT